MTSTESRSPVHGSTLPLRISAPGVTSSSPRLCWPMDSARLGLRARLATLICEYRRIGRSRAEFRRLATTVRSIAALASVEIDRALCSAQFFDSNYLAAESCLDSLWTLAEALDRKQIPAAHVLAHALDELIVLMVQGCADVDRHRIDRPAFATPAASAQACWVAPKSEARCPIGTGRRAATASAR